MKDKSDKISLKNYITGLISSNFTGVNKIEKYFRCPISDSTSKAIKENWIRILGIDYEIICMNLCKNNRMLGVSLEGKTEQNDSNGSIQRHYFRGIIPNLCIGSTRKFMLRDELLEVNGLKILGMPTKEVIRALKKVTNNFQMVVARSHLHNYDMASDYGGSEDNVNIPFYETEDDESSGTGTLRSVTSNYSTTSRDFGSSVSVSGLIDGQYENVAQYLSNIVGWRGPIVIELRREIKSFGLALQEISDPKTNQKIIVFKIILSKSTADQDGRLHVGDRLLHVNGKPIAGVPFKKVCQWMKSAPGGRLVLLICKPYFNLMDCVDHNTAAVDEDKILLNDYDTNRLPKLVEENENDNAIVLAPEKLVKILILERNEGKLGIFLDVSDEGLYGSRIKHIVPGLVKENGTLQQGDFLTEINGVSLRISDRIQLNHALRKIGADTHNYRISYILAEDLKSYKSDGSKNHQLKKSSLPLANLYPNAENLNLIETESQYSCDKVDGQFPKWTYLTFEITIRNDRCSKLGLVLLPSLNEPSKYISIIDIHPNSLAHQSGLFQINDDILMVNDESFENISTKEAGQFLRKFMENDNVLTFKIGRLVENEPETNLKFDKFTQIPDIYSCTMIKKIGFGFSLLMNDDERGALVGEVNPSSSASQVDRFKTGQRISMINNKVVINYPKTKIMQIVKDSMNKIDLVMELPKWREIIVRITKDSSASLGLNVAGGIDTALPMPIIESLVPNKMSKFTDELCVNDMIMEVDGKKMSGLSHEQIIQILRSTGPVSVFKICRRLPFLDRKIFDHVTDSDFPSEYLLSCKYSVRLNKPVDSIDTFGINFTNVVILDPTDYGKILGRYKAVFSIDKSSVTEKYAPEIQNFHYLISVNSVPVDCDMLCDDLKEIIDNGGRVNFVFSRDIPYNIDTFVPDSPILLNKSEIFSTSDKSSFEDLGNIETLKDVNINLEANLENEIVNQQNPVICYENGEHESNDECAKSVNDESLKTVENHCEKSFEDESMKTKEASCENIAENDCGKCFEDEGVKRDNGDSGKNVEDETAKTEKDDCEKSVEGESVKHIEDESVKNDNDDSGKNAEDEKGEKTVDDITQLSKSSSEISIEKNQIDSTNNFTIYPQDNHNVEDKNDIDSLSNNEVLQNQIDEELVIKADEIVSENKIDESDKSSVKSNKSCKDQEHPETDKTEIGENNNADSDSNDHSSELGIDINYITINKLPNVELGFQLFGGVEGGPNKENLPFFVIGSERNTCNWPEDHEEPYLKNGYQIIELNGENLSFLKLSKVQSLINEADGELKFKVVTFK